MLHNHFLPQFHTLCFQDYNIDVYGGQATSKVAVCRIIQMAFSLAINRREASKY